MTFDLASRLGKERLEAYSSKRAADGCLLHHENYLLLRASVSAARARSAEDMARQRTLSTLHSSERVGRPPSRDKDRRPVRRYTTSIIG